MLSTVILAIKNRYGSKYGLKNHCKYFMLTRLGDFNRYKDINLKQVTRLIFVCAGNICRSPLAEAVARRDGVTAESFGLHCRGGDPADPRAIAYAKSNGIELDKHITRNIKDYVHREGDLLIGMEPLHTAALEKQFGSKSMITLIGLWLPTSKAYIHDPFNANETFFTRCEDDISNATRALIASLRH